MNELVAELTRKVGISEEQAEKCLETITAHIKSKLPPMMHEMIDNFLSSAKKSDDTDFMG